MFDKKSQQALEFMLIFVFVIVMISGAMFILGSILLGVADNENSNQAENFAQNIQKEIEILSKMQDGYYRELNISSYKYVVNITSNVLMLNDIDNNKSYSYELAGSYDVKLKEVGGNFIIIFEKEQFNLSSQEGLDLNY